MQTGIKLDTAPKPSMLRQYGLQIVLLITLLAMILVTYRGRSAEEVVPVVDEEMGELVVEEVDSAEIELVPTVAQSAETSESPINIASQPIDLSNVPVLQDNSLRPGLNPKTFVGKKPAIGSLPTYTVERGDTPFSIAQAYNIKPETILGGNPRLNDNAGTLQVGQELLIMPIDGVLHDVQQGETLDSIANLYAVSVEDIIAYEPNNLEFPYRLFPDTQIIIPGAVREVFKWDPPKISTSGSYWASQSRPLIIGTGTFIWPVVGGRMTQPYWYAHQAYDIGVPEGSPAYASDTGTVTYASFSPYCYGNLIVVNHGNGYETFYAHLQGFNVVPGQIVFQGNVIGYTGNTGCSTGPHIHFEVRANGNRDDPGWYLP